MRHDQRPSHAFSSGADDGPGPRRMRGGRGLAAAAVACAVAAALAGAAGTVTAAELDLDKPVHAAWTGVPLRTWAERAVDVAGRPVVIDRRLDPDIVVTLEADGDPLGGVLETIARSAGAAVVPLRSSIRIVPLKTAATACDRAEVAREQAVGKLPAAARQRVGRRSGWKWPEGARPRDLIADALAEAGFKVEGLDRIPHDHFPEAALPPLALGERLDLVLAHFDLRIDWRGGTTGPVAAIIPLDTDLPGPQHVAANPKPKPKPGESKPPRGPAKQPGKLTYSLRAEAPLDAVLAAVATRLGVKLDIDGKALETRGIAMSEVVRVDVNEVSAAELIASILAPLGLTGKVVDGRLVVGGPAAP